MSSTTSTAAEHDAPDVQKEVEDNTLEVETDGFTVEVSDTHVKIYTLNYGVLARELNENDGIPELGDWCNVFDDGYDIRPRHIIQNIPNFKIWVENDTIHAQLFAIGPNYFELPKDIRKKFKRAVWSPILQYLNDENDLFDSVKGGEVAEVVVKYAPSDRKNFVIVKMVEWVNGQPDDARQSMYHLTPWTMEYLALNIKPIYQVAPGHTMCIDKFRQFSADATTIGVCIAHKVPNPIHNRRAAGSSEFCSYLWSPVFGLSRWLLRQENEVKRPIGDVKYSAERFDSTRNVDLEHNRLGALGKWYSYELNDSRRSYQKKQRKANLPDKSEKPAIFCTSATKIQEVAVEKPYTIVLKEKPNPNAMDSWILYMDVSFAFKRADIETPGYDPEQHAHRIRCDAHFLDFELGKVEIYPKEGLQILTEIDKHYEKLRNTDPMEYERLKDEVIIIKSKVTVINRYLDNFLSYPEHGLFLLKRIDCIHYLHGGKMIHKNKEKN